MVLNVCKSTFKTMCECNSNGKRLDIHLISYDLNLKLFHFLTLMWVNFVIKFFEEKLIYI